MPHKPVQHRTAAAMLLGAFAGLAEVWAWSQMETQLNRRKSSTTAEVVAHRVACRKEGTHMDRVPASPTGLPRESLCVGKI